MESPYSIQGSFPDASGPMDARSDRSADLTRIGTGKIGGESGGIRVQTGDSRTIVERRWGDGSESPSRTRREAGYDDTKRDRYGEEMSRGDFDAWLGGAIGQWTG